MTAPPPAPGHELFIYYRAEPARADAVAAAVAQMQAQLCLRHSGLSARLLCRPELREGLQTWMEAYRLPANGSALALAADIEQAAVVLLAQLAGPRHVEHFIECAS